MGDESKKKRDWRQCGEQEKPSMEEIRCNPSERERGRERDGDLVQPLWSLCRAPWQKAIHGGGCERDRLAEAAAVIFDAGACVAGTLVRV